MVVLRWWSLVGGVRVVHLLATRKHLSLAGVLVEALRPKWALALARVVVLAGNAGQSPLVILQDFLLAVLIPRVK